VMSSIFLGSLLTTLILGFVGTASIHSAKMNANV
jgi:hypothetical protein